MAQRKITIMLPDAADARRKAVEMLLQFGLISQQKAHSIDRDEIADTPERGNRWARVAEEMSAKGQLAGVDEELLEDVRGFRDDFEIPDAFHQND